MSRIAVVGAGAWGTALSIVLARGSRHAVRLWAHEREVWESIENKRTNDLFLPDCAVPEVRAARRARLSTDAARWASRG